MRGGCLSLTPGPAPQNGTSCAGPLTAHETDLIERSRRGRAWRREPAARARRSSQAASPGARLSAPSSTPRPPADWLAGLPFTAVTPEDGMGVELDIFGQIGQDVAGPDRRSRRRSPSSRSAAGTCDAPGHWPPKCCAAHREYSRPSLPGSVVLANRSRHVTAHRKPDGAGQWRHAPTRLFAPSWPVVEARRLPIRQRPGDQHADDGAGAVSPHDLLPWVMSTMRCVVFVCGVRACLAGRHRRIKAALGLRASLRCGRARACTAGHGLSRGGRCHSPASKEMPENTVQSFAVLLTLAGMP